MSEESHPQRPLLVRFSETSLLVSNAKAYSEFLIGALIAIEERLPIAGALIAIIGYIIIAAFGHMDNPWSFLGYSSFLVLGLLFYQIKKAKLAKEIYLLLGIIFILLAYIAIDKGAVEFVVNLTQ